MRRRELGARARLTSSSALDCSVPPPAIASSRTEGGSRESGEERYRHMGQCASRQGSAAAGGGGEGRRGCLAVAREQRSRFYIFRRCVAMLVCWHKYKKI
ncbi:hypothetical protein SETIT_9G338300v2 [Setaria italica]|uniref:Uncharacterized protein n=1 Tax=Setaria italica TaxID=4555 RepID=A0A368SNI9_SETIT|nr:hypothetical protein SETIT_9G338300v2 [Setaria italica]